MWVSDEQRVHTAATPISQSVAMRTMFEALSSIDSVDRDRIADRLEEMQFDVFDFIDTVNIDPAIEAEYAAVCVPEVWLELFASSGVWDSAFEVRILDVPVRWRLDVILTILDVLAEFSD